MDDPPSRTLWCGVLREVSEAGTVAEYGVHTALFAAGILARFPTRVL